MGHRSILLVRHRYFDTHTSSKKLPLPCLTSRHRIMALIRYVLVPKYAILIDADYGVLQVSYMHCRCILNVSGE